MLNTIYMTNPYDRIYRIRIMQSIEYNLHNTIHIMKSHKTIYLILSILYNLHNLVCKAKANTKIYIMIVKFA